MVFYKKIINKKFLIIITLLFSFLIFGTVLAAGEYGLEATRSAAGLTKGDIPTIIGNAIGAILSMVGVLFFGLMLYGGILWMVARGNQEYEKKALGTITAAIIGIIIVMASYAITGFVFEQVLEGNSLATSNNNASECSAEHSGWSCQEPTACGLEGYPSEDAGDTGDNWEKGLCTGGEETICCKDQDATIGECVCDSFDTGTIELDNEYALDLQECKGLEGEENVWPGLEDTTLLVCEWNEVTFSCSCDYKGSEKGSESFSGLSDNQCQLKNNTNSGVKILTSCELNE